MTTNTTKQQGPQTAAESDLAALALDYYRRAGHEAATAILERATAASENGCYREDLRRMLRAALAALPTVH